MQVTVVGGEWPVKGKKKRESLVARHLPCWFLCLSVVFLVSSAKAARLEVSAGEPVEIRIAVGVPTVVTFPETIKGIPTNANPDYVSMEADGSRLFVVSREEGFGGRVFVIGESDRLHILELVQDEPADTEVQLVLPQSPRRPGDQDGPAGRPQGRGKRASPMRRLLIAMLKGERLTGVEVLEHDQVLATSEAVEIRTTHVYAAGRYLGFLGTARNLTREPFVLRLPEYQAPGLKAIGGGRRDDRSGRRNAGVPGVRAGVAVLRDDGLREHAMDEQLPEGGNRVMPLPCWVRGIAAWATCHKFQAVFLGSVFVLIVLVLVTPAPVPRPPSVAKGAPVPDGRLADVTGDDVLYKLKVTQAAMQREMALLREWISADGVVLPEEADLARVLAALHVAQSQLEAIAGHLEAGQARLAHLVKRHEIEFEAVRRRLRAVEQNLVDGAREERN